MDTSEEIKLKATKFEATKLVVLAYLSEELMDECIALNEPSLHVLTDMFTEQITARLVCKFLIHKEGEYDFEWYASWWQELRTKILPDWWMQRHPSRKEVKKTVRAVSIYPSLKIGDVEHRAIIDFWNRSLEGE